MDIQDVTFDEATETYKRHRLEAIRAWASDRHLAAPVHIEIGTNRGRFLTGLAALHPQASVLGIEIRPRFVESLEEQLRQEGPPNAHVLCADANLALPLLFADHSVARFYVLFPDPWWKKRHAKRRLLNPRFLNLMGDKLARDGMLVIKTDVEPYAHVVEAIVEASPRWRRVLPDDPLWPQDEAHWPHTTRERKILQKGLPTWKIYAVPTGVDEHDSDESFDALTERFEKPEEVIDRLGGHRPRLRK